MAGFPPLHKQPWEQPGWTGGRRPISAGTGRPDPRIKIKLPLRRTRCGSKCGRKCGTYCVWVQVWDETSPGAPAGAQRGSVRCSACDQQTLRGLGIGSLLVLPSRSLPTSSLLHLSLRPLPACSKDCQPFHLLLPFIFLLQSSSSTLQHNRKPEKKNTLPYPEPQSHGARVASHYNLSHHINPPACFHSAHNSI